MLLCPHRFFLFWVRIWVRNGDAFSCYRHTAPTIAARQQITKRRKQIKALGKLWLNVRVRYY